MQKINLNRKSSARFYRGGFVIFILLLFSTACNHNYQQAQSDKPKPEVKIVEVPDEEVAVEENEDNEINLDMLDIKIREETQLEEMIFEEAPEEEMSDEMFFYIAPEEQEQFNTEEYDRIYENDFQQVGQHPVSTFSIDVDNASYSNVRRFLTQNHQLPPPDAVRIEEMINYFDYDYPQPRGEHPFAFVTEVGTCPWNTQNKLLHIGIQGKSLDYENLKPSNLVFLLDVSGSMDEPNKLPLVKKSFRLLLDALQPSDRVAMVVYAGAAGLVLPSTPVSEKTNILKALDQLQAGGSTAGGEGIQLAYHIAQENQMPGGNNRVILATDGDFNIGVSSTGDLVRMIEEKRKQDIYLTICGFGMGNYKDGRMEQISNAGNGNYFYIDDIREAEKVFVREMRANLFSIAKDVKIQIEFNPSKVAAYRLIGYENRTMAREDFDNDLKDAGELGAGHTVTALYEVIPATSLETASATDLRYQQISPTQLTNSPELLTLKFRYKPIDSDKSILIEHYLTDEAKAFTATSDNFRFAAAVAGFGMLLRNSRHKGTFTFEEVLKTAREAVATNTDDYDQRNFMEMVQTAALLTK